MAKRLRFLSRPGFGLIELLIALALIGGLYFLLMRTHGKPGFLDEGARGELAKEGINTENYGTVFTSTAAKLKDIQAQHLDEQKNI